MRRKFLARPSTGPAIDLIAAGIRSGTPASPRLVLTPKAYGIAG